MKTKFGLLFLALFSIALLGACKKEQAVSEQVGEEAATAINETLDKAKDAAAATEAAAEQTEQAASDAVEEAKTQAEIAVKAARVAAEEPKH